tara:strand:+ start:4239 stop:5060 length:822 start_codon:yes stop_codon:yes gene_type:complete
MCEPCEQENVVKTIPQEFKDALTCCICQDIATLPVHSLCCEKAKSVQPACLSCVRKWYQQDRIPSKRSPTVKSFGGCGCTVSLNNRSPGYTKLYEHSFQLDMVRNLLGPSVCFHEECRASFSTCEELRRHLQGKARQSDKYGNCQEALTKCSECSLFGKRRFIEGKHYEEKHRRFRCPCCDQDIGIPYIGEHIQYHLRAHNTEIDSINRLTLELRERKKKAHEMGQKLENLRNKYSSNSLPELASRSNDSEYMQLRTRLERITQLLNTGMADN